MLVSGIALVLACAGFTAYDVIASRQSSVYNLSLQAQIAGSNCVSALLFGDPRSATNTLSAFQAAPDIISAAVYTADGQPFALYWRDREGPVPSLPAIPRGQIEGHWFPGRDVVLVRAVEFQGQPTGFVYIRSDRKRLYARLQRYAYIAGFVFAASLLAALLVSAIFRRSTAEPIVRLAMLANTVSLGKDYSLRAGPTGGRDEVAVLVDAFNEMLAQIQRRDGAWQQAHNQMEKRVQERTMQLTAVNQELEAFSYSVSHDLRAPLRSMDGFSQILLDDYGDKLDEHAKSHLQRIRAATQRMATLIEDLLNLSRVTRGEIHKTRFDLSSMVRSVTDDLRTAQPDRQVELSIELGQEAQAEPRLVKIVLENLLNNAWKFTSKPPSACIAFGAIQHHGTTAYFVRDNGAGFDPAYAERLFGAFQRLHSMDEFPGTGVGLATVQRIIQRHGGRVWAESEASRGATFYFTLHGNSGEQAKP